MACRSRAALRDAVCGAVCELRWEKKGLRPRETPCAAGLSAWEPAEGVPGAWAHEVPARPHFPWASPAGRGPGGTGGKRAARGAHRRSPREPRPRLAPLAGGEAR